MTRSGGPRLPRVALVASIPALLLFAGCLDAVPNAWPGKEADTASAALQVSAEGPTRVAVGDDARFHAEANVPAGSAFWFWDFGDGVEHEGVDLRSVEHTFTEAGAYVVTVTVVDADGHRGVATARVGVDQTFAFEGSVSSTEAVGTRTYSATFPVRDGLDVIRLVATLERPSPAFAVLEPAPPEITLRVRGPANGSANGAVLLEERVSLDADPKRVTAEAAGAGVVPADATLEVVAESGSAHFTIELATRYG